MIEILNYYGYANIEEVAKDYGLNKIDAARLIKEIYEEDTAPDAN